MQQTVQRIDAELRPCLEIVAEGDELVPGLEGKVRDHRFALLNFRLGETEDVDNSQMDLADFRRVVVQERDNPVLEWRVDLDFLVHLALNTGAISLLVPREKRFIGVVHVTADTDRTFCDQALFTGLLAADVMQDRIAVRDQRVGNDLLMGRVIFRLGPRQKEIVPARENGAQIFLRLEIQAVKAAAAA